MKTQRNFTLALAAALAIIAISTTAWAAPPSTECGLIGTWSGHAGSSMMWSGIHTPGSTATGGEMLMNWTYVSSGLLNDATLMTPGHGVWQQIGKGQYKYTWYAYGIDALGNLLYSVRVSGLAANTDCNNVAISYTYEIFYPAVLPQDMSGATPSGTIYGEAAETRVPLVVVEAPAP